MSKPKTDLDIRRSAVFSSCCKWRYTLERYWGTGDRVLLFVLLNPSTAEVEQDDPTNRRGMRFARDWGYNGCVFVNLFAYRATQPSELIDFHRRGFDPIGTKNDSHIMAQAYSAARICIAWGNHGHFLDRASAVVMLLGSFKLWHLGLNKSGQPKHPLYIRADTQLQQLKPQLNNEEKRVDA